MRQNRDHAGVPLVVDVDGSLVSGDLLIEGIARFLATSPLRLLVIPFWLIRGRDALKCRIARTVSLPPATLVLTPAVLDEIASAKAVGREVWLASASDERAVAPLVEAVGATGCLASNGHTNLVGRTKATALVERFGEGGFDYIGNERRDLAVWKRARRAIGVNLSASLAGRVRALDENARFLPGLGGGPRDYFRALRPHQWVKNVLVFIPIIAAHETHPWLYKSVSAFVCHMCPVVTIYVVTHRLDERLMFMVGLFLVAFGFFALLPMGNEFPLIQWGFEWPKQRRAGAENAARQPP